MAKNSRRRQAASKSLSFQGCWIRKQKPPLLRQHRLQNPYNCKLRCRKDLDDLLPNILTASDGVYRRRRMGAPIREKIRQSRVEANAIHENSACSADNGAKNAVLACFAMGARLASIC